MSIYPFFTWKIISPFPPIWESFGGVRGGMSVRRLVVLKNGLGVLIEGLNNGGED
jgi:hypothetical protein